MNILLWARDNPMLVAILLAIVVLVVVAVRMARVPDVDDVPEGPRRPADAPAHTEPRSAGRFAAAPTPAPAPVRGYGRANTVPVRTAQTHTVPVQTVPVQTAPVQTAPVPTAPVRTVPVQTVPMPTAAAAAQTFVPQDAGVPEGYVPLEVPALWEPPVGYLGQNSGPQFAQPQLPQPQYSQPAQAVPTPPAPPFTSPVTPFTRPAAQPSFVARPSVGGQYASNGAPRGYSRPMVQPAPAGAATAARASAAPTAMPRSFDDLRRGVLAGRTFDNLQQFAVAAVIDAGHPAVLVARIFRVPVWKLEAWIDTAFRTPPVAVARPRRGTMPRMG